MSSDELKGSCVKGRVDYDGRMAPAGPVFPESLVRIEGFVWLNQIESKLAAEHRVTSKEVEAVFKDKPQFRFVEKESPKRRGCVHRFGYDRGGPLSGGTLHPEANERSSNSERPGHGERRKEAL
jgi:hypothetical protein